jgi:hypothetical protein
MDRRLLIVIEQHLKFTCNQSCLLIMRLQHLPTTEAGGNRRDLVVGKGQDHHLSKDFVHRIWLRNLVVL